MSTQPKAKAKVEAVPTVDIDAGQVTALLNKLRSGVPLQDEIDLQALAGIVETWAYLAERAQRFDLSMAQMRRALGVLRRPSGQNKPAPQAKDASSASSTSATSPTAGEAGDGPCTPTDTEPQSNDPCATPTDTEPQSNGPCTPAGTEPKDETPRSGKPARAGHGRRGHADFEGLPVVRHAHTDFFPGCDCPACAQGRLYRFFPRAFCSISGQAVFQGRQHEIERLQCNVCAEIYEAPLPDALKADGVGNGPLYTYSAHSAVVLLKYLGVVPWHRQQTVQTAMGVKVPDACMWDMCRTVGDILVPIAAALKRVAATAPLLYGDDTSAKILGMQSEIKIERRTGKPVERTGCHTTTVIAELDTGQRVAMFRIGIQHTGELIDEILSNRGARLPAPLVMTDAASCNSVTACRVSMCACNAHALRKLKDLEFEQPARVVPLLEAYRAIYKNDETTKSMTAAERLEYHRKHSRPLFKAMCQQAHDLLEGHAVEPNSKLGSALDYLLNHQRRLSAFYRLPGAPMDNNLTERELRLAVRLRDAAPLYRSTRGADVAAGVWTVLVTAMLHGENAFDYFNAVQRYASDVQATPGAWLPYNYRLRFDALRAAPPAAPKPDYTAARQRAAEAAENDW